MCAVVVDMLAARAVVAAVRSWPWRRAGADEDKSQEARQAAVKVSE